MPYKNSAFLLHITIPFLIAVISVFVVSDFVSRPEYTERTVASIDESREDVLKLAASSTAVSVALTALPGDLATPVADNLAELSKGFLVVLCALYLEKFLLSVTGIVAFRWLIPIACLIYIVGFLAKNRSVRQISYKVACFAFVIFLAVPLGAGISNIIREQYGDTIDQIIESAENSAGLMEESIGENDIDENTGNGLGKILENLQQTGDTIARGTSQFMKYMEKLVNRFVEVVAIMIVTSCLVPILVVLGLVWISKMIFLSGSEIKLLDMKKEAKDEKEDS